MFLNLLSITLYCAIAILFGFAVIGTYRYLFHEKGDIGTIGWLWLGFGCFLFVGLMVAIVVASLA